MYDSAGSCKQLWEAPSISIHLVYFEHHGRHVENSEISSSNSASAGLGTNMLGTRQEAMEVELKKQKCFSRTNYLKLVHYQQQTMYSSRKFMPFIFLKLQVQLPDPSLQHLKPLPSDRNELAFTSSVIDLKISIHQIMDLSAVPTECSYKSPNIIKPGKGGKKEAQSSWNDFMKFLCWETLS